MRLWIALARETGWGHTLLLAGLALLSSLVEVAGLGLAVGVLLGACGAAGLPLPALSLGLRELLMLLVGLMALRGLLQVGIAVLREWLSSALTDRLRSDLLSRVLYSSSLRLEQVGRGELLGLLMDDIDTSVNALDRGLQLLQSLISLLIYAAGVVLAGRGQATPLLLGLVAAALAGLAQCSGAWQLGGLQTRLNAALQSIVGDGLHGLKAVLAAGAEPWKLPARGDCPATEHLCRARSGRGRADACREQCWHHGGPGQWFGLTPPERATMGQRVERRSRERFDFASVAPQLLLMLRGKLIRPLFH